MRTCSHRGLEPGTCLVNGLRCYRRYQWGAIGILLGYFLLFSVVMTLIIKYKIFDPNIGSTRIVGSEESDSTTDENSVSQSSKMPFTPLTLAFNDIKYDVQLPSKEWKRLLRGISGVAKPGKLTSLMGVSGSGKVSHERT